MNFEALAGSLPSNGRLVLEPLSETVPELIDTLNVESPLGFAAIDVDYYSSTKDGDERAKPADQIARRTLNMRKRDANRGTRRERYRKSESFNAQGKHLVSSVASRVIVYRGVTSASAK